MNKIFNLINKFGGKVINAQIVKAFPRHSTRFAKKYFENKPITVVEIGTFEGENAANILKELNVEKLYIIDPYKSYAEFGTRDPETEEKLPLAYYRAKKRLNKYKDKIVLLKKKSDESVNDIPKADFVYIDGNHAYEFVKNDIKNYFPKVKDGGILAGHDITNVKFNKDIVKAVMEFCMKRKIVPFVSRTDWWFIKK